jgi:hypothetical protein
MASVKLYRREVGPDELPMVCMRCGAAAAVEKRKTFSWYPGWVNILFLAGLLPWAIVAMILTKRMTVHAPLCRQHKNHWLVRTLAVLGGLAFIVLAFFTALIVSSATQPPGRGPADDGSFGLICVGSLVGLLVLIVIAAICQMTAIRPMEITDRTITLAGVAPEFIDALEAEDTRRRDVPEDYDERFERRGRRKTEEYYDPDKPRGRRSQPNSPTEDDARG